MTAPALTIDDARRLREAACERLTEGEIQRLEGGLCRVADDSPLGQVGRAYRLYRKAFRHLLVWLYAIQAGEGGAVKLGITKSPSVRLTTLQQGNAERLIGLAAWRGFPEEERSLHRRFADLRLRGEWFRPTPELVRYVLHEGASFCDWEPQR